MRTIMVMNAKGGCGKTTIATNLASYYASELGATVALADYDPLQSSLDWLALRPAERAPIKRVAALDKGLRGLGHGTDYLIIDSPARSSGSELAELVRHTETIVVPVLPSPVDINAAVRFIEELRAIGRVVRKQVRIGLVANRIREHSLMFDELNTFLEQQKIPFIATLREAQNYVRAFSRGLGIYELPQYLAWRDWEYFQFLIDWLESRRSVPK
jgi:chromosome partitioning protein